MTGERYKEITRKEEGNDKRRMNVLRQNENRYNVGDESLRLVLI